MKRKVWDITVKDNPNRVVMGENDEFYTTDTEAYLVFNLEDKNFDPATAVLTLENRNDGSLKNETVDVVDGLIEWEMPQRYIEHFGNWQGQLVYYDPKEDVPEDAPEEDKFETYTSAPFSFVVNAHIGDKKKPSLVEIENWEKFIREGTELIETWEDLEALREENERQRQANYQELLDTGVLQTNINQKLAEAEQEYAPRLTELEQNDADLTAQLAQTEKEMKTERTHVYNNKESDKSAFEIHNFSEQEGRGQPSEITHHYTDAVAKVIDNVGENTILVLSNSQNATNRPDKPADYVGTGKVLQYRRYSNDINNYEIVFEVTRDGNVVKTGKGSGSDTAFRLINQKDVDGLHGFTFENTKEHVFPFQFRNGGAFMTFVSNANHTMAQISSASRMSSGFELVANAGDLHLKANSGTVKLNRDGSYFQAQLTMNGFTESRPTENLTIGLMFFDLTLGKPIWYKGGGIWCDATGSAV